MFKVTQVVLLYAGAKRFHRREGRCACFEPPSFSTFPHLCVNYSSHYETGYTWRNQSTAEQSKINQSSFQSRSETQENLQARLQEELRDVNQTPAPSPVHLAKTDLVTVLPNTSNKWWFESSHVKCSRAFVEEDLEMGLLLVVETWRCYTQDTSIQRMGKCPCASVPSPQRGSSLHDQDTGLHSGFGEVLVHRGRLISYCDFSALSRIENPR